MNVQGFAARADIVGRRIRIAWDFAPGPGETLANIPPVTLRRKQRDFAFPTALAPDPYLVYDSGAFPPAPVPGSLGVIDLDGWEETVNGERIVHEPISVAVASGGRFVEVLRRTVATVFDLNGNALRQRVEILDAGGQPGAITANAVYYYQIFNENLPEAGDAAAPYRDTAMATDSYGQNRTLYNSLPEVYRLHDVATRPPATGTDSVPEMAPGFGQLRRFVDLFGIALDSLRGTAEGLRGVHDLARANAKFLPAMASWIGWDLSLDIEIPLQRNEIMAAPRLYRVVGGLPGLRALVSQYTGWYAQVAEFAQNIALANQPPLRNLMVFTPDAIDQNWHGFDDAAETLGFPFANQSNAGVSGQTAALTSLTPEPFALHAGAALTISVDGGEPVTMRFGAADFANIAQATAKEVAAAIGAALPAINVTAQGGKVTIASDTFGLQSLLQILPSPTSLLSLDSAPQGRLATATDSLGRLRLFYEAWETPTPPAPDSTSTTSPAALESGNNVRRRLRTKCFVNGGWRDSQPVFTQTVTPQADPAAATLADDRIFCAWIDNPATEQARLRWTLGTPRAARPASLRGRNTEPFTLTDWAKLTFAGNWAGSQVYNVHAADFANIARATATELATAANKQLTAVTASRQNDGSVAFATVATGDQAALSIDLAHSTTARALGFDSRNCVGAPGAWDDTIDWSGALDATTLAAGRQGEVTAAADPAGGVRLAWSCWQAGQFRIRSAHWRDRTLVATANGAFSREGAGAWTQIAALPSADIRAVKTDALGTAWIATASGLALLHPNGGVAALGAVLPSPDTRDLALAPDGSVWIATAAGLARWSPGGAVTTWNQAAGLPSNDIRALALAPDASLWVATGNGAALVASGAIATFGLSDGLPSLDIRAVAVDGGGTAYLATGAGLAIIAPGGGVTIVNAKSGLVSDDLRGVAVASDGTLRVGANGGVCSLAPAGAWQVVDASAGLNSNDIRGVAVAPDGGCWVASALGVSLIGADGSVAAMDLLNGGGANPAGRAIHTGWSAALELANGGDSNREPVLALDAQQRLWLAWTRQSGAASGRESWSLHTRIYDPALLAWNPEQTISAPPVGGRASDRTPALLALPAAMRLYFASDRNGGFSLWSVDVGLGGAVGPLVALPEHNSSDLWPCPVILGGTPCVIYRGDGNVSLGQAGVIPGSGTPAASGRAPDNGSVRLFSGSTAVDLGDANRLSGRRAFGDMASYTPNRPDGAGALANDEYYTRGTVGLYVTRALQGADLTRQQAERLDEMLQRFLPINTRALVILVEPTDVELVYQAGAGPLDSYSDVYPFVSYADPVSDSSAASMPGLSVLHANLTDNVSANPADQTTLRRRSFFPPLQ